MERRVGSAEADPHPAYRPRTDGAVCRRSAMQAAPYRNALFRQALCQYLTVYALLVEQQNGHVASAFVVAVDADTLLFPQGLFQLSEQSVFLLGQGKFR